MANGTWMTHGRGAHGGPCRSRYAAGPGLPPSTAASEAGVACARWLRHPLCRSHQFSTLPGFPYRWPCLRIAASPPAGRHSFPAPPAASARLTSNMVIHTWQELEACSTRGKVLRFSPGRKGRRWARKTENPRTSPSWHPHIGPIGNKWRHVMARYAFAATVWGRNRVPAGKD